VASKRRSGQDSPHIVVSRLSSGRGTRNLLVLSHGCRLGLKVINIVAIDVAEHIPAASVPGYFLVAVVK